MPYDPEHPPQLDSAALCRRLTVLWPWVQTFQAEHEINRVEAIARLVEAGAMRITDERRAAGLPPYIPASWSQVGDD